MKGFECRHERREFARVIGADGRTQVMERCLDCGDNARGPGKWVAASQVPVDPATLPVARDLRSAEAKGEQRTLFGGEAS